MRVRGLSNVLVELFICFEGALNLFLLESIAIFGI